MDDEARIVSSSSKLVESFNTSTLEFYGLVEANVQKRQAPDIKFTRKNLSESHIFSSSREYLLVSRKQLTFAICSAPYGTGQFFSWWLLEERTLLERFLLPIPIIGRFYETFANRTTFYQEDTKAMFRLTLENAVNEAIDEVTTSQGRRNPTPVLVAQLN